MSTRNPFVSMTLAAGALCLVSALGAWAQLQSGDQQLCINKLNKGAALLAKTQGAENANCVKLAGKGTLVGTAQACLTADAKGKVAQKGTKMTADENAKCVGSPPNYAYTSAATMSAAAKDAEVDLAGDVFGPDLDAAIISCATSKPGCTCQQKVSKAVEAVAFVKFFEFVKCKKAVLKAGATSSAAVAKCVNDVATVGSIAADSSDKVAKSVAKLEDTIVKKCDTPGVTASAFPGTCTGLIGNALATCLDTQIECRVCQAINEADGFFVNCDLFDDGLANATCESGTGPTPTPTPTQTATPTPTATFVPGTIFKGTLPRTSGNWFYMAMAGQPGGEALCNSTYAGTHVCTITNLESAEALGELVAASDNMGAVIRFWKVDPGETNLRQCINDIGTLRWNYGTAHTLAKGIYRDFTAATGVLSDTDSGLVGCPGTQASVGCCL